MGIQVSSVLNAIIYAAIGIVIFAGAFLVIDKVTPYNLWKEIVNQAIRPPEEDSEFD